MKKSLIVLLFCALQNAYCQEQLDSSKTKILKEIVKENFQTLDSTQLYVLGEISASSVSEVQHNIDKQVQGNFGVVIEQDWFVDWLPDKNFDRNYTQGTMFYYSKPSLRENPLFIPINAFEWLASKLGGGHSQNVNVASTLKFGLTAFTPLVIDSVVPVVGDRPFSNIAFLTTQKSWYNLKTGVYSEHSFNFGWMGSNIAYTFQSWAHKSLVLGRPTQISWDHQVSRGGSFAFMYTLSGAKTILDNPLKGNDKKNVFDLGLGYKVNIGWYTGVGTSLVLRIGSISKGNLGGVGSNSDMTNYNKSNITASSREKFRKQFKPATDAMYKEQQQYKSNSELTVLKEENDEKINRAYLESVQARSNFAGGRIKKNGERAIFDCYAFGKVAPRLTPYNAAILGQVGRESLYTLPYEDYNPFILDVEYGLVLSWLRTNDRVLVPVRRWDILLSLNHRSPEIRPDNEYKRWHHWGKVAFDFALF
ncbi:hypothetical protein (DUF2219) [Owenweeksia hongkongensis DSM 17368]|uniref:Uncharacterized protein n=1 Tax=Owenweeksia hongkongensis (strain DSM 17368 / CIP 108786 / JCM 12287 / NRRL B-23963 / UST20020801) TaxID=926562 RepID=G8R4A5_OWEHD|nr:lipid A-modifier LpxR family protein [Owenweeksia hongkongensis]AEV34205.1 hypothetical protein (DUF2219) [Owenweeksia hongkongensis DSM 17368]